MNESVVHLGEAGSSVGIVTEPLPEFVEDGLPAVLLLNAGIVHRVGPNRLYVRLARILAGVGLRVLRFDLSGIGDSGPRPENFPFPESAVVETREAMNHLRDSVGAERFVLIGICSGAAAAFRTACCDHRVDSMVLINGQAYLEGNDHEAARLVRNETMARHYRRIALHSSFRIKSLLSVIRGRVDVRGAAGTVTRALLGSRFGRVGGGRAALENGLNDLRAMTERGVRLLFIHSEGDEGLDYLQLATGRRFAAITGVDGIDLEIIKGANHTFTMLWSQKQLLRVIREWAEVRCFGFDLARSTIESR